MKTSTEALMQRLAERTTERDYHMRVSDQLAERIREKDAEIARLKGALSLSSQAGGLL